jgi:PAS domain S-box-containing protein
MRTDLEFELLATRLSEASGAIGELKAASDAMSRMTRELREQQRMLEQIMIYIPAIVMVIDPVEKSVYWTNRQFENMLGWTSSETSSNSHNLYRLILAKEDHTHFEEAYRVLSDGSQQVYKSMCRMNSLYNEVFRFNTRISVLDRNPDGTPKRLLCVAIDITQQTETENELKALLREMTNANDDSRVSSITRRELQIIQLIAKQQSTKQIAETLHISIPTVETHRRNLLRKVEVKNTAGLIRFAAENQLLD